MGGRADGLIEVDELLFVGEFNGRTGGNGFVRVRFDNERDATGALPTFEFVTKSSHRTRFGLR